MKKLKPFVASSLMAVTIISVPALSFADNNNNNKDKNNRDRSGIIYQISARLNRQTADKANDWNRRFDFLIPRVSADMNARLSANTNSSARLTPSISGITAPTVLKLEEMGTWKVNASDPRNGSLSYAVDWGDSTSKSSLTDNGEVFVQTATFNHAYSKPGVYTVKFTVKNSAGFKTSSSVSVNVVGQVDQTPVISNLIASSTRPRQGTVTWDTDIRASGMVWLSKTSPVNTALKPYASVSGKTLKHSINLSRLEPNTKYFVVVGSANGKAVAQSAEISFTTPALNNNAPVIVSLTGSSTVAVGETEVVTIKAYDPKNGSLTYSADWGDNAPMTKLAADVRDPYVQTATLSHVYDMPGTYTATFTAKNEAGQTASKSMVITVTKAPADTQSPVIRNIEASAGSSTAMISWMTNEPATSKVYYSVNNPVDVNATNTPSVANGSWALEHSLNLSGLSSSTQYYFVVESVDEAGNRGLSNQMVIMTGSGQ